MSDGKLAQSRSIQELIDELEEKHDVLPDEGLACKRGIYREVQGLIGERIVELASRRVGQDRLVPEANRVRIMELTRLHGGLEVDDDGG